MLFLVQQESTVELENKLPSLPNFTTCFFPATFCLSFAAHLHFFPSLNVTNNKFLDHLSICKIT
jgi:hypothetical protein